MIATNIRMALASIKASRTRSFLTMTGVVIGRYDYLIIYDVVDDRNKLKRVSDKEVMLYRKDAPMIKVNSVSKLLIMDEE